MDWGEVSLCERGGREGEKGRRGGEGGRGGEEMCELPFSAIVSSNHI